MPRLYEKYRPASLDQVVGQDKAVSTIRRMLESGKLAGQSVWLSGASCQG